MTWNPTTGCTKISAGCKFCYAEIMAKRLQAMGLEKYKDGFKVRVHESALQTPYSWKKSQLVFVNSMSDLFHPEVPLSFIKKVFEVMNNCSQHIFQVLTKRADRLLELHQEFLWTENIWMGVSIEDNRVEERSIMLSLTNAQTKFLSCEPLIGSLDNLSLTGIDWVIVGGESGRKPRPIREEWVLDIKNKCETENVAFFFKQWGGKNKKAAGRLLQGKIYDAMPEAYYTHFAV